MATKVAASAQPWKGSWDILVGNTDGMVNHVPEAVATVYVGSSVAGDNYIRLARDAARAYQLALRYHGDGSTWAADKAVEIMNAWASTHAAWDGDSNVCLRAGLYGHQFACAAELLRDYDGWDATDFAAFQQYMIDRFSSINSSFLYSKLGTVAEHYWSNWTLSNVGSLMAIGVLCDDQSLFDLGKDYFLGNAIPEIGSGTENINNSVHFRHPNGLGQWQESGRDQGHTAMGPQLTGVICEIAWNQGIDLYGYKDNLVLSSVEYISKYNLWEDVPWVKYFYFSGHPGWPPPSLWIQNTISSADRGTLRVGMDLIYNHYVNRLGCAAPYTEQAAELIRPEGGGFNYGGNSGGFDGLGFTTLTHSLDPIASSAVPSHLLPYIKGRKITLSWAGSAYAESYNVKRSTTPGGPYTTLGVVGPKNLSYSDSGLTAGTTYYYVVSANNPGGEGADSTQVAATADGQLYENIIGTPGSNNDWGATRELAFDGSLKNFIDLYEAGGAWVGVDLGAGASAVITSVKYCPRADSANRMVGGTFQGSNTADFSSGVVDLFTIATAPPDGVLTTQSISNGTAFRYIRYIQTTDSGWNTLAEVQFLGNATGLAAPAAPSGLIASARNGYNMDIEWSPVSGATGYKVKRATTPGGPYVIQGDTAGTAFVDNNLPGDTTYYYTVCAYNSAGESINSTEISAMTQSSGPHLLAYFKMDGNADDSSVNGYHATEVGSPVYATGYGGQAMDLDAVDDYVQLSPDVSKSDDITIAAWVNWDGIGTWSRIFDFGTGTDRYLFLTPKSGDNTLRFAIKNGGGEQIVETSTLAAGTWVHVAVTLNGNTARLYVNGSLAASNSSVTINPSDFNPSANYIGKSQYADPLFDGRIDEFRIYNYALSAAEVDALAGAPPPPDTTPPAAPAGLAATVGDGYVDLAWLGNHEIDLADYTVYRSTTSGSGYTAIASGLVSSNYLDSSVVNGITYYYVVTATDVLSNESDRSAEVSALPLVPVTLSNGDFEQCTQENYPTGFDSPYDVPGWTDLSIADAGVENDAWWGTYDNYSAFMKAGDGAYHMSDYIIREGDEFVVGFVGKSWDGSSEWTVTLFYDTPANVIGTYVQTVDGAWAPFRNTIPIPSTAASVGGTLGVSFVNTGSGYANLDNVTLTAYPSVDAPSAPTDLVVASGDAQVTLSWDAVSGATSYNVKRSLTSGSGYGIVGSPVGTNLVDTGLTNGVRYYFVVSATGVGGESTNSVEVSAVPSVAVSSNEFHIASHSISGGTNLSMIVSNSVPGHVYGVLASDTLTPPAWTNIMAGPGTGSNLLFGIPISNVESNRFYKLDVQRQ